MTNSCFLFKIEVSNITDMIITTLKYVINNIEPCENLKIYK